MLIRQNLLFCRGCLVFSQIRRPYICQNGDGGGYFHISADLSESILFKQNQISEKNNFLFLWAPNTKSQFRTSWDMKYILLSQPASQKDSFMQCLLRCLLLKSGEESFFLSSSGRRLDQHMLWRGVHPSSIRRYFSQTGVISTKLVHKMS